MDELFLMPASPLAAPNAYWLPDLIMSSQIMLIQPSTKEFKRVSDAMLNRQESDFDMEIVNYLYKDTALRIPARPYNLITGVFRSTNHANYVEASHFDYENWNATRMIEEARFVHFSDWPLPKPWIPGSKGQVKAVLSGCPTDQSKDCDSLAVWAGIYDDYWRRKAVS